LITYDGKDNGVVPQQVIDNPGKELKIRPSEPHKKAKRFQKIAETAFFIPE
jgi:hypothetical protein